MKKLLLCIISVILTLGLSGCGKMNLDSNTQINSDGSGYFSMKVLYDDIVAKTVKGSILKEENVMKYMKNKDYAEEYKVNFKSISELNKELSAREKDYKVTVREDKGVFANTYTYEMRFLNYYDATTIANNLRNKTEAAASTTNENDTINDFLEKVAYTNTITVPGQIISTNATESSGNTLKWTYSLGQISPETVMTATYATENISEVRSVYSIGIIMAILTIVYVIVIKYKLSKLP